MGCFSPTLRMGNLHHGGGRLTGREVSALEEEKREARFANLLLFIGFLIWILGSCNMYTILNGHGPLFDMGLPGYILFWIACIVHAMMFHDIYIDYRQVIRPRDEVDDYLMFIRGSNWLGDMFPVPLFIRAIVCLPATEMQGWAQNRKNKRKA